MTVIFRDYDEALAYFYTFAGYASRRRTQPRVLRTVIKACGLDAVRNYPKIMQVTGTNGKGSVCANIERLLLSWGEETVCLTSPHINSVRERIKVCGRPISKQQFCEALTYLSPMLERVRGTRLHLRPMQIITLMALMLHAHLGEDCFGIYEVGMGGRYDSTNVFTRSTVGLCTISEDHLEEFGGSLVALAQEKVALCSAGSTLFSQVQVEPALAVIEEYCRRQGIQRHTVSMVSEFRVRYCLPTWFLSNMALAWNLATHLCPERESKDVPPDLFAKRLPRRFEERDIYGRSFLLDGAHNQRAVEALLAHLNNEKSSRPKSMVAIVGFSVSKNWMPLLRQIVLSPLFKEIAFTQATRPRGVEPNHLVDEASDTYRCRGFASLKSTLDWAFNSEHRQFVIFGSLLLAADFDKALHALGLGHFAVDAEEIDPQQPWMHPLL